MFTAGGEVRVGGRAAVGVAPKKGRRLKSDGNRIAARATRAAVRRRGVRRLREGWRAEVPAASEAGGGVWEGILEVFFGDGEEFRGQARGV